VQNSLGNKVDALIGRGSS